MSTAVDRPEPMPCHACAAGLAACNAKRLVSGRHCCDRCSHAAAPTGAAA